jgi:hypothetical protein
MFNEIDKTEWKKLRHAFGSVRNIPLLLQSLILPNEETREKALIDLYNSVWYSENVCQATPFVIPFLIEILDSREEADRFNILIFLAKVARDGDTYSKLRRNSVTDSKQHLQDKNWAQKSHDAVKNGMNVYLSLIYDEDEEIRAAASYVLSRFLFEQLELRDLLWQRLQLENSSFVRASLIANAMEGYTLYGETLTSVQSTYISRIIDDKTDGEDKIVKVIAALQIASLAPGINTERAINILLETILRAETLKEDYQQLPIDQSDIVSDACNAVCLIGRHNASAIVPSLAQSLSQVDESEAQRVAYALLYLAFDNTAVEPNVLFCHLSDEAKEAITAILNNSQVWHFANISQTLRLFGLPDSRQKLIDYVS